MILKPNLPWHRLIFQFHGTSLRDSWPRIAAATFLALGVTVTEWGYKIDVLDLTPTPFTLVGVAISIFLGFRNNTAYGRFWEGRVLWGGLVNHTRNLARQLLTLVCPSEHLGGEGGDGAASAQASRFHREMVYRTIGFVHALRHHLRQTDPFTELPSYLPPEEIPSLRSQRNVPLAVLQGIAERLVWARKQGWIHPYHVAILESSLTELINLQGACERIKSTPVPFTYTVLSHRIVAFFCFFLPFGIVDTVGLLTPLVVFLVSHAFFGLDVIGDEIEEPFGVESHHLPLTALCRTIEVNLRQMLGESEVPPFLQPVDGVLM